LLLKPEVLTVNALNELKKPAPNPGLIFLYEQFLINQVSGVHTANFLVAVVFFKHGLFVVLPEEPRQGEVLQLVPPLSTFSPP
jgi:hypothetical protein